ncbi:hypothetical protein D3C80_1484560 [compost metagenome]
MSVIATRTATLSQILPKTLPSGVIRKHSYGLIRPSKTRRFMRGFSSRSPSILRPALDGRSFIIRFSPVLMKLRRCVQDVCILRAFLQGRQLRRSIAQVLFLLPPKALAIRCAAIGWSRSCVRNLPMKNWVILKGIASPMHHCSQILAMSRHALSFQKKVSRRGRTMRLSCRADTINRSSVLSPVITIWRRLPPMCLNA